MDLVEGLDKVGFVGVGEKTASMEESLHDVLKKKQAETDAGETKDVGADDEREVQRGVLNPGTKVQ